MSLAYSPPSLIKNRYRLTEWVGQSHQGITYRAVDEALNQEVIVRFLLSEDRSQGPVKSQTDQQSFPNHEPLSTFSQPDINIMIDSGSQSGWAYVIMSPPPAQNLSATPLEDLPASLEEERRHMALLLQTRVIEPLNLLLAQAASFEQTIGGQPSTHLALSVLSSLARQVLQQARDLGNSMNPSILETLGLEAAFESLKDQLFRAVGFDLSLELERLPSRLPEDVEIILYRLAQDILERIAALPTSQAVLRLGLLQKRIHIEIVWKASNALPSKTIELVRRRLAVVYGWLAHDELHGHTCLSIDIPLFSSEAFTPREMEILQGLVDGLSNKQLAARLSITPRTVNFHLDHIYAKLGVNTRTEAALIAQQNGWVRPYSSLSS